VSKPSGLFLLCLLAAFVIGLSKAEDIVDK
jgi:hypothetical protein